MDSEFDLDETHDEEATEPTGFHWPIGWGVMLAIGWLAYELTAQPPYGIAVTCTKVMWKDLAVGWWWFRRDHWTIRGICGMLLVWSRGLERYFIVVLFIAITLLIITFGNNAGVNSVWYATAMISLMSLCIWFMLGILVTVIGGLGRVPLWIDASLHISKEHDLFPPVCTTENQLLLILFPTWGIGFCLPIPFIVEAVMKRNLALASPVFIWLLLPLARHVVAHSPDASWNAGPQKRIDASD